MRKLLIGDLVVLKREMLNNPAGTIGICYEEYDIGDGPGVSIIFPNGNYDGFSPGEQDLFLKTTGHIKELEDYYFTNVMQLTKDYEKGLFDVVFEDLKYIDNIEDII